MSDADAAARVGPRLVTPVQPLNTSRLEHYLQSEFYLNFNRFRIAAIRHGVLARAQHGNAASDDAMATGGRTRLVADVAWTMAQSNNH